MENYGHTDPATGLSTRLGDFLAAFDRVVDYAIENSVDLVLFCGDAYKTREPTQTQQREFAKRIIRLSAADIPTFLLVGNHDLPNAIARATTTEIFDTLAIRNVYVSNRPDVYRIPTRSGTIQVASLPWLRRSTLLSREEGQNLGIAEVNSRLQEALTQAVANCVAKLDPTLPAILAAHASVVGAKAGSENLTVIGQEHTILISNLANPAFDYVALGHFHRHQVLNNEPPAVYSGSIERVDFAEEKDEKGFCLVNIETDASGKRRTTFEFLPIQGRPFLTISVELDSQELAPTETVLKAVTAQADSINDAVVRLNISFPASIEAQVRYSEIRAALKTAHYSTIVRDSRREARAGRFAGSNAGELKPIEALKAWLDTRDLSPERNRLLLEYGEKLLEEQKLP